MTQSRAGKLLYAAGEHCADLRYLSGLATPDAYLWFADQHGRQGVIVSALEYGRALKECHPGIEVIALSDLKSRFALSRKPKTTPEWQVLALSRGLGIREWQVPAYFPFGLAQALQRRGLKLRLLAPFCPGRAVKTPAEIELVRGGVRLAEAGLARAEQILRQSTISPDGYVHWQGEPLLAETLRGEIEAEISRRGGIAQGTITAPGVQGADPHQSGQGPIPAHQPLVIDIFPRCQRSGYHGDLTRTLVKGQASEVVWRAFTAVAEAQKKALAALEHCRCPRTVHQLVVDYFAAQGYVTEYGQGRIPRGFFHSTGHGLGLEVHEAPGLNSRETQPLLPGHVVTVEPGLYYPEWGGVRLEDVVALRSDGCDNLTSAPIYLEVQ